MGAEFFLILVLALPGSGGTATKYGVVHAGTYHECLALKQDATRKLAHAYPLISRFTSMHCVGGGRGA